MACHADIGPLLAKCDDPKMAEDPSVSEVVKQLDRACREAGFFYVVLSILYAYKIISVSDTDSIKNRVFINPCMSCTKNRILIKLYNSLSVSWLACGCAYMLVNFHFFSFTIF